MHLTHKLIVFTVGQRPATTQRWQTPAIDTPVALVVPVLFFQLVEAPTHGLPR
jgi:hypothetical protein